MVGQAASIGIVILAAGSATRMGSTKQLAPVEGRPLLQHVLDRAAAARLSELVLVLGHDADRIQAELDLPSGTLAVRNPRYGSGQASSLAAGLAALSPGVHAAMILLGDQPDVRPDTLTLLADRFERAGRPAARARYRGEPGHPVILSRDIWTRVVSVGSDAGAASALARHPEWVTWVDVDVPAPQEIDTPDDLARVVERGLAPPEGSS